MNIGKNVKECTRCHLVLPLDQFYKSKRYIDKHLCHCKQCAKKEMKEFRKRNPIYFQEYEKNRQLLPERRKSQVESKKGWNKRNPEKRRCINMVGDRVYRKKIIKPIFCQKCGVIPKRMEGHHDDYKKPFDIKWLCLECHRKIHKSKRRSL
jgi:hypothetical protein